MAQEMIQRARDLGEWKLLKEYFSGQVLLGTQSMIQTSLEAARIYFDCRRAGTTVRSSVDCLIAQTALENGVPLLNEDRDFKTIGRIRPLRLLPQ